MSFQDALNFVLPAEGGESDDAEDHGGLTYKGVTQAAWNQFLTLHGEPSSPVTKASDAEIEALYEKFYWEPGQCDKLPDKLATVHFDCCVNSGVSRACKFLQMSIPITFGVKVDTIIGSQTLEAISKADETVLIIAYLNTRREFYNNLAQQDPTQQKFLTGWLNRLDALAKATIGNS